MMTDLCAVGQSYDYLRPDLLVKRNIGHLLVAHEVDQHIQNGF